VCVLLSSVVSDWVEGAKISLVLQMPSKRACHTCDCLVECFSEFHAGVTANLRSNEQSKGVVTKAIEMAKKRQKTLGKKLCSESSLCFRPNVLWDFDVFDVHQCLGPDCLHVLDLGIFEWLLKFVYAELESLYDDEGKSAKLMITTRLAAMPYFPALVVFPNGIEKVGIEKKGKFQGAEYRNIMKQILAVLFDLVPAETVQALLCFLNFYESAKAPWHTEETLENLKQHTESLFERMARFKKFSASELNFPKLHVTVHFDLFIRTFGRLGNLDAETFETFHHHRAQIPYEQTNKQKGTLTQQVTFFQKKRKETINSKRSS